MMTDEPRGRLARAILQQEKVGWALAAHQERPDGGRGGGSRRRWVAGAAAAVLWVLSIAVAVVSGSVPAGFAILMGGAILYRLVLFCQGLKRSSLSGR
jgi:hypothetical protein